MDKLVKCQQKVNPWSSVLQQVWDQFKAYMNQYKLVFLTGPPQHLALGVHVGADASVAVRGAVLAELAVLQEDVGGAVGGGACTELRQVAVTQ